MDDNTHDLEPEKETEERSVKSDEELWLEPHWTWIYKKNDGTSLVRETDSSISEVTEWLHHYHKGTEHKKLKHKKEPYPGGQTTRKERKEAWYVSTQTHLEKRKNDAAR